MKKIIGLIILALGFLVSGYGMFIFVGAIYYSIYSQSHPEQFGYGDAAGMGFLYGLIIIIVGIIPIVFGNLIMSGKQSVLGVSGTVHKGK